MDFPGASLKHALEAPPEGGRQDVAPVLRLFEVAAEEVRPHWNPARLS